MTQIQMNRNSVSYISNFNYEGPRLRVTAFRSRLINYLLIFLACHESIFGSVNAQLYNLTTSEFDKFLTRRSGSDTTTSDSESAADDPSKTESNVPSVTNSNWFVIFHVNWCTHCKHTVPIINKVANDPNITVVDQKTDMLSMTSSQIDAKLKAGTITNKMVTSYDSINFASIDCTDDKSLVNRFGLKGYPGILFFDKGAELKQENMREYSGGRSPKAITNYLRRMLKQPVVSKVQNWKEIVEMSFEESMVSFIHIGPDIPQWYADYAYQNRDKHVFLTADLNNNIVIDSDSNTYINKTLQRKTPIPSHLKGPESAGTYVIASPKMAAGRLEIRKFVITSESDINTFDNPLMYKKFSEWATMNKFPGVWMGGFHNFYELSHAESGPLLAFTYNSNVTDSTEGVQDLRDKISETFLTPLSESDSSIPYNYYQGGPIVLIDFVKWHETLANFHLFPADGDRVWLIENKFENWREDKDYFTVDDVFEVAQNAKKEALKSKSGSGSGPIDTTQAVVDYVNSDYRIVLQGRDWWRKRLIDIRSFIRYAGDLRKYAEKGPYEAVVALMISTVSIVILYIILFLIWQILMALYDIFMVSDPNLIKPEERKKVE